ncbi:MAG: hypothetical protein HRT88_11655 [Lentisphaeraceae bacterium]|nr:hypothetical protein [Lentisphaeraceae bacterium]
MGNVKELLRLGTDVLVILFKDDVLKEKKYLRGVKLDDIEKKVCVDIKNNQLMLCVPMSYKEHPKGRRELVDKSAVDKNLLLDHLLTLI